MKRFWLMLLLLPGSLLAAERIVAIGGDVTQIVFALGAGGQVVARDSTSLHPASVKTLPDVGYMRQLNAEGILSMKPTLVLVSALAQPSAALEQVAGRGVRVVAVPAPQSLSGINTKITAIAEALGIAAKGRDLTQQLDAQLAALPSQPLPTRVLFVLSHHGMSAMAAGQGTAADAAIRAAGLQNAMQDVNRYQPLSQEGVVASQPDWVVVTTDGMRSLGGGDIWALPGLAMTPAGRQHRVVVVDDMAMLGFSLDTPAELLRLRQTVEAGQ
ncbi:heme/hemin ABC transporter substrate-binding protein [Musicola paradisiaca]|uniref:Periplasmic binding protein n=1 Tax=Musicola paradisiaca (strain Ech703) TaxID=579405 RepID=C6CCX3_MUSP7|nr:ABC transporter substrate-binding protein [Musicola paradisiaca]ACS85014.1 periplasmic binding protein [Musicola paradisiaca Ech703]